MKEKNMNQEIQEIMSYTDFASGGWTIPVMYREWDFAATLGDSIKEKYESLMLDITNVTRELKINMLAEGYLWISASPEIASIIETSTFGYEPSDSDEWKIDENIVNCGIFQLFSMKWRVIKSSNQDPQNFMVGVGKKYCLFTVKNFII